MNRAGTFVSAVFRRLGRQGTVAAAGVLVAIVLVGVSMIVWSAAPSGRTQANDVATGTPTPAATDTVAAPPNHEFKSQSGNLRCSVGQFSGRPGAICQQLNINYSVPFGACIDPYQPGVFVGVSSEGAYWPCVASWPEPAEIVAFDTPVTQNGITCSINYDTGVKCVNEAGQGFTMEYDAGVTQF